MTTERIDIKVSESGSRVVKRNVEEIGVAAKGTSTSLGLMKKALVGLGGVAILFSLLNATKKQEEAVTQLNAVLKSTQGQAGLTSEQLQTMAGDLQKVTRYGDEATIAMQAVLLTFTGIKGDNFKATTEVVLDMATALKTDLKSSAIQVGKALNEPVRGMSELRRVGVSFTQEQIAQAKAMVAAGDAAGAQKIILDELQKEFGGSARAARETLGGALEALGNAFGDLLEAGKGVTEPLRLGIEWLITALPDLVKLVKVATAATIAYGVATLGAGGATGILVSGVRAVGGAMLFLSRAILANPIVALVVGITSAITAMSLWGDEIQLGVDNLTTLGDLMQAFGEMVGSVFDGIAKWSHDTFGGLIGDVQDWVGSMDVSVIGILSLVARGVDGFIGLWSGAVAGVIVLFGELPETLGIITERALNYVLRKIEGWVNAAGEALSKLTDFVGLGTIGKVDITPEFKNKDKAITIGAELRNAIEDGYNRVTFAEDILNAGVSRAEEIAKARKAAADKKPGGDAGGTGAPAGGDGAGVNTKLAAELEKLIGSYDRVWAAQQEAIKSTALLDKAEAAGLITSQRKAEVLALIKNQLQDALDPLAAINREMDRESALLGQTADARAASIQIRRVEDDLKQQGVILSDVELAQMRERIVLLQQETKLSQARDQILQNTTGATQAYTTQLEALNQLVADGSLTQEQANNYLVQQNQDLLAGTAEAQQAWVQQHEDAYARVNALSQQHLISEQTRNQLLAKADAELVKQRLSTASQFFGTLAGLSQSGNAKVAAIGKSAALFQATLDGIVAIQKAYTGTPYPYNIPMAAAMAAIQGANVAAIASQSFRGYAFGGEMKVGGVGGTDSQLVAFRATPGERVRVETPSQQQKSDNSQSQQGGANSTSPVKVINVIDPAMVGDYLSTSEGDRVFLNLVRRNSQAIRAIS